MIYFLLMCVAVSGCQPADGPYWTGPECIAKRDAYNRKLPSGVRYECAARDMRPWTIIGK